MTPPVRLMRNSPQRRDLLRVSARPFPRGRGALQDPHGARQADRDRGRYSHARGTATSAHRAPWHSEPTGCGHSSVTQHEPWRLPSY